MNQIIAAQRIPMNYRPDTSSPRGSAPGSKAPAWTRLPVAAALPFLLVSCASPGDGGSERADVRSNGASSTYQGCYIDDENRALPVLLLASGAPPSCRL